jgi:TPP-dependent pyruvate/acetoin dehydrogenase alpha subunit
MSDALSKSKSYELFYSILRIRMVEEEVAKRYSEQEMRCPVHLSVGQEATPVGVSEALRPDDVMVGTHRSHAHYLAKGGSLKALIAELYGRVTGCTRGQGGSMHLIDVSKGFIGATSIVGGTVPIGVGAAFGFRLKKEDKIAVVAIGDTVVEEGVFHESANFAALKKLPVIFMCENNGYSCYSPLKNRQPERPLTDVAIGHGLQHFKIDGNNVFEIYQKVQEIAVEIRKGSGPVFIEFPTYRFLEHCGPNNDDNLKYREAQEIDFWKQKDPLFKAKEELVQKGFWEESVEQEMKRKIQSEIIEAFDEAIKAPYPSIAELGAYTYAE